jgi:glycosyltransferase involved in cell wall biosynthesis
VRDLVSRSRYARSTIVVCPPVAEPFPGIAIDPVPASSFGNLGKALAVGRMLKRLGVEIVIVENHLPAAAAIAVASGLPTVLQSHAYEKSPKATLKRIEREAEIRRLAGFAFVSADCAKRFGANFPKAKISARVVPNGLDMRDWSDVGPKEKTILVVGRALDDKGHLEAMSAIRRALSDRPEWSARFILSAIDSEPKIVQTLREAAKPLKTRVTIEADLPYREVKAAWSSAAIGMVLTKTPEPFGRTALEALASGAALMTSGLGGLAEVCGPDALIVDPTDAGVTAAALVSLIDFPERRAELAGRGRARVEALYDIRIVASIMDDFVDEILQARRAR